MAPRSSRRMIHPCLWESETIASLEPVQRLLFIGLFSLADDQGRLRAHPALISARIFPFDNVSPEDISQGLAALAAVDSILLYSAERRDYIQLVNWWRYQRPTWAWPSDYPAPDGWQDRHAYRRGNRTVYRNWPGKEDSPDPRQPEPEPEDPEAAPDPPEPDAPPDAQRAQGGATVAPQRGQNGATVGRAPSGSNSTSGSGSGRNRKKNDAAENGGGATARTHGQTEFLRLFGAKRFRTTAAAETALDLERTFGTRRFLDLARWAATKQMTLGDSLIAIQSRLEKEDRQAERERKRAEAELSRRLHARQGVSDRDAIAARLYGLKPETIALWRQVQARIRGQMDTHAYIQWLAPALFLGLEEGAAVIGVASEPAGQWLNAQWAPRIIEGLQAQGVTLDRVRFVSLESRRKEGGGDD